MSGLTAESFVSVRSVRDGWAANMFCVAAAGAAPSVSEIRLSGERVEEDGLRACGKFPERARKLAHPVPQQSAWRLDLNASSVQVYGNVRLADREENVRKTDTLLRLVLRCFFGFFWWISLFRN